MNCIKEVISFSTINDDHFHLLRKGLLSEKYTQTLSPSGSIHELITQLNSFSDISNNTTNCKYYDINELSNIKQAKSKKHLNSLHLNIQSLFSHIDDLKILLALTQNIHFDLIGITETRQTTQGKQPNN